MCFAFYPVGLYPRARNLKIVSVKINEKSDVVIANGRVSAVLSTRIYLG